MKLKKFSEFINEKLGWKDIIISSTLGASILNPQYTKCQNNSIYANSQIKSNVLLTVTGPIGIQPIDNPDLDLVHGILGSKRLDDDFEKRVSDELKRLNSLGIKTDVDNIQIKTYIKNGKILTESSCDIIESKDGNSYEIFTTRGSIGQDFEKRHDDQIRGLDNRLQSIYGGNCKKIKTFLISFYLNGEKISYKQSFFVCSKLINEVTGSSIIELRENIKKQTANQSIDLESLKLDLDNLKLSYKPGNQKIKNISLIFDNQGDLESRIKVIQEKNPTLEILKRGNYKNYEWIISVIY